MTVAEDSFYRDRTGDLSLQMPDSMLIDA
jgi:hypothetical protein